MTSLQYISISIKILEYLERGTPKLWKNCLWTQGSDEGREDMGRLRSGHAREGSGQKEAKQTQGLKKWEEGFAGTPAMLNFAAA